MKEGPRAGLYVHVPFCERLCLYCDFYSSVPRAGEVDEFINALGVEASLRAGTSFGDFVYDTIFLGGGTPSLLKVSQIKGLFQSLRESLGIPTNSEITIECNPSTIDMARLTCYKGAGVNRISLGVQSFNDGQLKRLGRLHDSREAIDSFKLTREAGFSNVNIDLIYGLPDQTLSQWQEDLKQAITLDPDHIAAYNLIIEPETTFGELHARGELRLPSERTQARMYDALSETLSDAGYARYEISNFARPGRECRHNLKYWHLRPYLGLGPAAVSFDGVMRMKNASDLDGYLEAAKRGGLPPHEIERLADDKLREEFIMMAMRLSSGLSVEMLKERFGYDMMREKAREIDSLANAGYIIIKNGHIRLAPKALFISDGIIIKLI